MSRLGTEGFWKGMGGTVAIVAVLAALVAVNLIIGRSRARVDLTGERLYTLSSGTMSMLKNLKQPVTLKLFFSSSASEMPVFIKDYAREVEDLLREYVGNSGGKLVLEKYDPAPDSEAEEWAQKYGVAGQPFEMGGAPLYFGLVGVSGDQEVLIPAFDPRTQETLEYNVTRLIYRVAHPEKPVVGVMSSLPVLGGMDPNMAMGMMMQRPQAQPPWLAFKDIQQDYTVKEVPTTAEVIDPAISALVLVHAKDLSDKTLYAIDQFVLRGGRLLAFVDPLCVVELDSAGQNPMGMPRTSSSLDRLFGAWGVDFSSEKVIADLGATTKIRGGDNTVEDSPVFLTFVAQNMNRKDIVTAQIETLMLPFAGSFSTAGAKGLAVESLLSTGPNSAPVDSMSARFGRAAFKNSIKPSGARYDVALRLSGTFKTAFPDGKPKDPASTNAPASVETDAAPVAEGKSAVILVGDVDLLYDRFCVEEMMTPFGFKMYNPRNDNLTLFANVLEQVAGSQDLIGIRSRGRFSRPFDKVLKLQEKAMLVWQTREQDLEKGLTEAQTKLRELEASKDKSQRFILSDAQKQAIAKFKEDERAIKKELKLVRKNLRRDIEREGLFWKVINIGLMPALVTLLGVVVGLRRR